MRGHHQEDHVVDDVLVAEGVAVFVGGVAQHRQHVGAVGIALLLDPLLEVLVENLAGLQPAPTQQLQPGQSALFDGLLHQAPTWDDIAWLRSITRLPVLLKGVLHPADATQAVAAGAAGVIVSNHGGRTLDTAPPTAVALPRVAQAVAGAVPVLVDGGIRRGTDVLKAMALGASAVLVGRPAIWGLANAGAAGVAHVLRLLRDELEIAMALTGCATLADASQALLNADLPQGGDL